MMLLPDQQVPDTLKRRAAGLRVKHDGTYNSGGFVRAGVTPTDDLQASPGMLHPLVCRHPETGSRRLYLARRDLARGLLNSVRHIHLRTAWQDRDTPYVLAAGPAARRKT
jgi:hypothetical protein